MQNIDCPACHVAMQEGTCVGCSMNGQVCPTCKMCADCANVVPKK